MIYEVGVDVSFDGDFKGAIPAVAFAGRDWDFSTL